MTPKDWLKRVLTRTKGQKAKQVCLPPAPRTLSNNEVIVVDDGMLGEVEEVQKAESTLPDGRKAPPLKGKSGTVTGVPAYCPNCNDGREALVQTPHQLLGYSDGFTQATVKCVPCKHIHVIPFAPKVNK